MSVYLGRWLQVAAAGVLILGYACLCHYSNTVAQPDLGAALALGPVTIIATVVTWRSFRLLIALGISAAGAGILYLSWPTLRLNYAVVYLVEESGAYLLLATTFSQSLRRTRVALCTRLADLVHGPLSAAQVRYTRHVTAAWALFFYLVAAASVLLFVYGSLRLWSLYANFCVAPLIAAMFAGEQLVRRRVLPEVRSAGLLTTMRVYFATPRT